MLQHVRDAQLEHFGPRCLARCAGQRFGGFERAFAAAVGFLGHGQRLVDREQQLVGGLLVGNFLPVDHAIDEIDRLAVARIGQQDPAVQQGGTACPDEFRLEPDRRLVGKDLQVMVGNPAQHRASGHCRKQRGACARQPGFAGQLAPHETQLRVVDVAGQVEQDRIGAEIGQRVGIEVGDQRQVEFAEQACPVIISPHLHAALILANRRGWRFGDGVEVLDIVVEVLVHIARAEKAA